MKRVVSVVLFGALFAASGLAQGGTEHPKAKQEGATTDSGDWKPATVAEITYSDDERSFPAVTW